MPPLLLIAEKCLNHRFAGLKDDTDLQVVDKTKLSYANVGQVNDRIQKNISFRHSEEAIKKRNIKKNRHSDEALAEEKSGKKKQNNMKTQLQIPTSF